MELPDYLSDLNAMHEAEKVLTDEQHEVFVELLYQYLVDLTPEQATERFHQWYAIHATAAQRAKALLRTLGKWDDSK